MNPAASCVLRGQAERAGATITEVEGSHVIADVIETAAAAVSRPVAAAAG